MGILDRVKNALKPGPVTFAPGTDPIEDYMATLAAKRFSPRTIRNYRLDLRLSQKALGRPLLEATPEELAGLFAAQVREGLESSTIRRKQATLRGFYRWAMKTRLIQRDPSTDLEAPKQPERLPIHLGEEQIARLFAALRRDTPYDLRDEVIVKALYYTGMRASELAGLDWERVDLERRQLRVIGKGNRERCIPIPAALVEVLQAWQAETWDTTGPVVVTVGPNPKRLKYDAIYRAVRGVIRDAGLAGQGFSPHKLRHSFATRLVNNGMPIDRIQKLLGHKQITTTGIYAHTEIGEDVRRQLDDLL